MRPSFEALCELEDRVNTPLPQLVIDLQLGNVSLTKLTAIVWSGIWGYNKEEAPSILEVGQMLIEDGMLNVVNQGLNNKEDAGPIVSYLVHGVTGGVNKKKEGKSDSPKK
jgi:hypothetical protein